MPRLHPRSLVVLMLGLLFTELAWADDLRRTTATPLPNGVQGAASATTPWQHGIPSSRIHTYPPVMTVPAVPRAYMDKNARDMRQSNWQFYCRGSEAYFPYIQNCPGGWELVSLHPDLR